MTDLILAVVFLAAYGAEPLMVVEYRLPVGTTLAQCEAQASRVHVKGPMRGQQYMAVCVDEYELDRTGF